MRHERLNTWHQAPLDSPQDIRRSDAFDSQGELSESQPPMHQNWKWKEQAMSRPPPISDLANLRLHSPTLDDSDASQRRKNTENFSRGVVYSSREWADVHSPRETDKS